MNLGISICPDPIYMFIVIGWKCLAGSRLGNHIEHFEPIPVARMHGQAVVILPPDYVDNSLYCSPRSLVAKDVKIGVLYHA